MFFSGGFVISFLEIASMQIIWFVDYNYRLIGVSITFHFN